MIRHLLKLVWNRKRTNALIILEIFFAFLVLFIVGTLGIFLWDNIHQPLGFAPKDVWTVAISMHQTTEDYDPNQAPAFLRLLKETQGLAPVESVAGAMVLPYSTSNYTGGTEFNGRHIRADFNDVTEDFAKVMGLRVTQGRWFEKADETTAWEPVVINETMARAAFGAESPIGKRYGDPGKDKNADRERRVIGVIREFKKGGELSAAGNYVFQLKRLNPLPAGMKATSLERPPSNLVLNVRPGTPVTFEEDLAKRLQAVAPSWSFEIKPMAQMRASAFRLALTPLVVGGIVALFLMLMVGLGLIGVLWQNLLQRTREIGLRRATGASRSDVHRQVLWEQLILTSFGVLLGSVLVVQIPLLDLVGFIRPGIFLGGMLVAMLAIYLLAVLCALYPSTMASRVQPAEALRYE
ncbi:MAG TPA: FtsX-like permease family protein [Thermoanaerobaculia bacterium]|jgi:putative ABC transport system permease protein|nr:FtsX-like permease family protein [Thermoanaerobaculia bacterium]